MTIPHDGRKERGARTAREGVLDKAVAVLDAVEAGGRTYTALVQATGFPRPTVHRLIKDLERLGFLIRVGSVGYMLGPRLLQLAGTAKQGLPLRDLARPVLEHLAAGTGESTQLYVRSGNDRVCIDSVQSSSELRTIVEIGARLPLTAGSAGKVFLTRLPAHEIDRLLAKTKPLTERTPTADQLRTQIITASRRGWAESSGEREAGVASVSAPVFGPRGELLAAVSVSGPQRRMGPRPGKHYAAAVTAAARDLERALGF